MTMVNEKNIIDIEKIIDVFGQWPSFHDAEIVNISLDRAGMAGELSPILQCAILMFGKTDKIGADASDVLTTHNLITLRFLGIEDIQFQGFNNQNVLWDLIVEEISGQNGMKYNVEFSTSYGMSGSLVCTAIHIVSVLKCDSKGKELTV